ncbi:unnamed protein product, partial [Polarella glacialis]
DGASSKAKVIDEPLTLSEVESCDILEFITDLAKDKSRFRLLQRTLTKGPSEVAQLLLKKAGPFVTQLASDQCGNYITQKVLEAADDDFFRKSFEELRGCLLELSQDPHGTRVAQKVVEEAVRRGMVDELLE